MVIKAAASQEVRTLVDALGSVDEVTREAAAARLAVIGARAVDRLIGALARTTDRSKRIGLLRVLESIGDDRAVPSARGALLEGGDVAIAGVGVLRRLLDSPQDNTAAEALDTLMSLALDREADRRVRLAACDALQGQSADVRDRVLERLRSEAGLTGTSDREAAAEALWKDAVDGRLPDDPGQLREIVSSRGPSAPLSELRKLVDEVRRTEGDTASARTRVEWCALRGSLHQALALRNSRVALYDLRETLGQAERRLPVSFLAAVQVVGDAACLEALAAAFSRAPSDDAAWKHQVSATFRALAKRARITGRHAAARRLVAKWPDARELFTPGVSTPLRTRARSLRNART